MKDYIISKLKEMGFNESRIARGIEATKCESLDQVMDWIINDCEREDNAEAFVEDDDCLVIDDQPAQAQNLNQPADSSGQEQGQEKTVIKKELSEEEKEMEKKRLEEKIKQRRAEREAKERAEEIEREKNRRKTGSEISKMREEMQRQEQIRLAQELRKRKLEKLQEKQAVLG
jgi:UBX domain-containing protein, putative